MKTKTDGTPITDNGEFIPNIVNNLTFMISKHFIGDSSLWKDKSIELLSNLKCRTLGNFRCYIDIFLIKVYTKEDNQ